MDLETLRSTQNLVSQAGEQDLSLIGQRAKKQYEYDKRSMKDWLEVHETAMALALQVKQQKNYPFDEASNVIYPLITTASIQFAARAYPAVISGRNVVKCKVVGDDSGIYQVQMGPDGNPMVGEDGQVAKTMIEPPGIKASRAGRRARWMNNQLLEQDESWEEQTDKLLHYLPIVGCAFRKRWWQNGPKSKFVPASRIIVDQNALTLEKAPQITEEFEEYPHEIMTKVNRGFYDKEQVDKVLRGDEDNAIKLLECHCRYDLDGDGYPEPYIVTMHEGGTIFAITNNFGDMELQGDKVVEIKPRPYYTKYDFMPNPDGFYGIGFGWLIGPINEAINTSINQLNDAAHWQNAPSYFVGKGVRLRKQDVSLRPNEMKPVDAFGADLKNEIVKVEAGNPSPVTFNFLTLMIESGRDVASVKDILLGGGENQNLAPTTALTLAEQGMKSFTAIFKRVHRALKRELKILDLHNTEHVTEIEQTYKDVLDEAMADAVEDYKEVTNVVPVTDPDMVSDGVQMAKNDVKMNMASNGLLNPEPVVMDILESMNVEEPEKYLPKPSGPSVDEQVKLMKVENDRMRVMTAMSKAQAEIYKLQAEGRENLTKAVLNIAKAEGEEAGQQLSQYQFQADQLEKIYKATLDELRRVQGMVGEPSDPGGVQGIQGQSGGPGIPPQGAGLPQPPVIPGRA